MSTPGPYAPQSVGDRRPVGDPPPTNLIWGVLSTIIFCLPLGIVSIVKATQVKDLWAQGDYDRSRKASAAAKKYGLIALVIWAVILAALVVFSVLSGSF